MQGSGLSVSHQQHNSAANDWWTSWSEMTLQLSSVVWRDNNITSHPAACGTPRDTRGARRSYSPCSSSSSTVVVAHCAQPGMVQVQAGTGLGRPLSGRWRGPWRSSLLCAVPHPTSGTMGTEVHRAQGAYDADNHSRGVGTGAHHRTAACPQTVESDCSNTSV